MSLFPKWLAGNKADDRFMNQLLEAWVQSEEKFESLIDERVKSVLLLRRWQRTLLTFNEAFVSLRALIVSGKEHLHGRYRIARSKIRGSTDEASGGSAGAAGLTAPISQFAGSSPAAGFAQATTSASLASQGSALATVPFPPAPPPMRAFEDAGIKAGEVRAYRSWRLKDELLYSVYESEFCWQPNTVVEGDAASGFGVHAFKSVLLLAEYGKSYASYGDVIVTGEVDLWGEVYEHERGFRASKAAIVRIFDDPHYDASALRKRYGLIKTRVRKKK